MPTPVENDFIHYARSTRPNCDDLWTSGASHEQLLSFSLRRLTCGVGGVPSTRGLDILATADAIGYRPPPPGARTYDPSKVEITIGRPCTDCDGVGTKPLFTSHYTCETCDGKGTVAFEPLHTPQAQQLGDVWQFTTFQEARPRCKALKLSATERDNLRQHVRDINATARHRAAQARDTFRLDDSNDFDTRVAEAAREHMGKRLLDDSPITRLSEQLRTAQADFAEVVIADECLDLEWKPDRFDKITICDGAESFHWPEKVHDLNPPGAGE